MVKQEQGETLRKYMRRFFDKRATVVDVTDKEVIDLFQEGLYHRRTFEDFGRRRPKSIIWRYFLGIFICKTCN
jgi:hypothetical protein